MAWTSAARSRLALASPVAWLGDGCGRRAAGACLAFGGKKNPAFLWEESGSCFFLVGGVVLKEDPKA